jgi:hypothetical protein
MTKPNLIESQKTRLEVYDSAGGVWLHVIELTDVPTPTASRSSADVTTLDDSHKRRASSGVIDYGSLEFKGLAIANDPARGLVKAAFNVGGSLLTRVVLTDNSYEQFDALVTKIGREIKTGDKVRFSFSVDIDGDATTGTLPAGTLS